MIDFGTGENWRQLSQHPGTLRIYADVPSYDGIAFYLRRKGSPLNFQQESLDGAELSLYGGIICYSPLTLDYLFSIGNSICEQILQKFLFPPSIFDNIKNLGQRGGNVNGFLSDKLGNMYMYTLTLGKSRYTSPTRRLFKPTQPYVRDPRFKWCDNTSVGFDGHIYFSINQLPYQPDLNEGLDGRQYPGSVLRSRLPDEADKK